MKETMKLTEVFSVNFSADYFDDSFDELRELHRKIEILFESKASAQFIGEKSTKPIVETIE